MGSSSGWSDGNIRSIYGSAPSVEIWRTEPTPISSVAEASPREVPVAPDSPPPSLSRPRARPSSPSLSRPIRLLIFSATRGASRGLSPRSERRGEEAIGGGGSLSFWQ